MLSDLTPRELAAVLAACHDPACRTACPRPHEPPDGYRADHRCAPCTRAAALGLA